MYLWLAPDVLENLNDLLHVCPLPVRADEDAVLAAVGHHHAEEDRVLVRGGKLGGQGAEGGLEICSTQIAANEGSNIDEDLTQW